ncbi:MAG: 30S ribosomal protein S12 methylthiotransferase RimO [Gammaproteobacteria bacterium]|nr:30S ribosomal protein S12 methylthiotransferase RimO [Gammaproteobacteria bacterium]
MSQNNHKIGFISLGCPKATVDSEQILTQLRAEGYELVPDYDSADLVVVNTCGFIDDAVEESLDTIGEALQENGKVIVTGCLGAKGDVVQSAHPQVLAVTGPHATTEVLEHIHTHLPPAHNPYESLIPPGGLKLTPRHYAYMKISEGCNHRCSFCIIPSMRGDLVSRPIGEVMQEAENLVSAGVRELLVVSQDTSAYGVDTRYRTGFWGGKPIKTRFKELAEAMGDLDAWVRLHYVYPYPHVDEVIPLMADGKVLPYLDIPLQHANHDILKAMKRPANAENMLRRIENWREICPDITLRSTFIVGFPGETETQFEELLDFIKDARLDRVGAFVYSPVEGAVANNLPNHVALDIQEERLERFMELQAAISADKLQDKIGKRLTVLVDELAEDGVIARSKADAPEIDGTVFVHTDDDSIREGDFIEVEVLAADEHDLWAQLSHN